MKIAAAQIKSVENNTELNIQNHLRMIDEAAIQNVKLIVFPEMSLTSYNRELAMELSFVEDDDRLNVFIEKVLQYQMMIIVGAPILIDSVLYIGSFIFSPDGSTSVYTKQFLHKGEEKYFSPSFDYNPSFKIENEKVSIAICADIANPLHPGNARRNNTTLYVASIFYTPKGIKEGHDQLSAYASKYSMNVLMANFCGSSYNLAAGGQSAFWNNNGELLSQLDNQEDGLLIVEM